jgi:hypothetical protein
MYSWKSWHDSRHRLALYAGACLAVGAITGLDIWGTYHFWAAWIAVTTNPRLKLWDPSFDAWAWGINVITELMLPVVVWSSLVLGVTSVGREDSSGAMTFILTRPQKRWRIVWDEWALSVAEISIILSMLVLGMVPFLFLISRIYVSFSGLILPAVVAVAACLYGLTQFLTLLTRSSAKGLSATIAVILFYLFRPSALDDWWHISWPSKVTDLSLSVFRPEWDGLPSIHWEIAMLWVIVGLIFPFLSQWLIERREV